MLGHISTLAILSVVVVSCGGDNGPRPDFQAVPQVAFENAPAYARACAAANDDDIGAIASYKDMNVKVRVLGADPAQEATISLSSCPQAVAVGTDDHGAKFLIVATVDYESNETSLAWFVDTDADDLPDAASEMSIESLADTHIVSLSYSLGDAVMYAVDARNDVVYRYADTSGDNVPDAASRSTMVEGGGVLGPKVHARMVVSATSDSVVLIPTLAAVPETMHRLVTAYAGVYLDLRHTLSDTNGDGVADAVASTPLFGFHESVRSVLDHGDDEVLIETEDGTAYSVAAESPTGARQTLATFVGNGLAKTIALSRGLDGDEVLVLIRDSDNADLVREEVRDQGRTYVNARVGIGAITEGDTVGFSGRNIDGTESVDVRRRGAQTWTSVVATLVNGNLGLTMPDLGLASDEIDNVEIRISDGTTQLFFGSYYIRGQ